MKIYPSFSKSNFLNFGYTISHPAFLEDEFEHIKNTIEQEYRNLISNYKIKNINKIDLEDFSIKNYHKISYLVEHKKAFAKVNRCLKKDFCEWFSNTSYMHNLRNEYGNLEISDEENLSYPNIYWRLTRPKVKSDVGKLHRDEWFWEIDKENGINFPDYPRIKTWISINVEPGKNGLLVSEFSHLNNLIKWEKIENQKSIKPSLSDDNKKLKIDLLKTENNSAVTFHDKLIHGGSINNGKTTRVSVEFTCFIKNK